MTGKLLGPVPREVVRRLREENDQLRLELASKTEDYERQLDLQKAETQKWRTLYEKSRKDSLKPYLEPTKASEQKRNSNGSTELAKASESRSTPLRDNQGKIMPNPRVDRAGFMRPTSSSCAKRRYEYEVEVADVAEEPDMSAWDIETGTKTPQDPSEDDESTHPLFFGPRKSNARDTCYCNLCVGIRDGTNEEQVDALRTHTRLRDVSFYQCAKSAVHVPYKLQKELLEDGEAIAQKTLYDRVGRYWPGQEMLIYPHGESSISFGRGDLTMGVPPPDWEDQTYYGELCSSPGGHLSSAVERVVALRNRKCHPNTILFPRTIDRLLYTVQNLASELKDLERAEEARRLRDKLQAHTKQSYDDIAMYEPLSNLPGNGTEWHAHHLATFDVVRVSANHGGFISELSSLGKKVFPDEVVKRAAYAWKGQYMRRDWEKIDAAREAKLAESNDNKAKLIAEFNDKKARLVAEWEDPQKKLDGEAVADDEEADNVDSDRE